MKGLLVTIIDVIGILVPGLLFLAGLVIIPPFCEIGITNMPQVVRPMLSETWVQASIFLIIGYILGFILRLFSIRVLQYITLNRWIEDLKKIASPIEKYIIEALNSENYSKDLIEVSIPFPDDALTKHAPYFHFAKRIVRSCGGTLLTDVERIEAELRFMTGLFLPMILLSIDAFMLAPKCGSKFAWASIPLISTLIIYIRFPSRRVSEVLYIYYYCLIALKYPKGCGLYRGSKNDSEKE